jgi:hypothetical protein
MPCLLALLAVLFPRIAILVLYFFTNFFEGVYNSLLLPLLGLIFLPVTLLAYTWMVKINQPMDAFFLIVMIVAIVLDLGLLGGSARRKRT